MRCGVNTPSSARRADQGFDYASVEVSSNEYFPLKIYNHFHFQAPALNQPSMRRGFATPPSAQHADEGFDHVNANAVGVGVNFSTFLHIRNI